MKTTTRNACILFAIAGITLAIGLGFLLSKDKENLEPAPLQNVFADLPEAEQTVIPGSKSNAYMTHQEDKSKIEDYWDQCSPDKETPESDSKSAPASVYAAKSASTEDLFGVNEGTRHSPAPKKPTSNPYRESAEEREARHQRRHEEAIALAERMQEGQNPEQKEESVEVISENVTSDAPAADVKKHEAISYSDGWGAGLSSLDEDNTAETDDPYTPFRCMFARESKITDGQRVTVILLDDLTVSGVSVPRNTHLMATCQLSTRLELEFVNIEIGGRILALGYEAYDIDGSKGIYCPDVGTTGKTIKSRGTDIIGSSLSGRLGRVAREVTSTGISLIQNADGQRTVSIPAGYTFFIVKKKLN